MKYKIAYNNIKCVRVVWHNNTIVHVIASCIINNEDVRKEYSTVWNEKIPKCVLNYIHDCKEPITVVHRGYYTHSLYMKEVG